MHHHYLFLASVVALEPILKLTRLWTLWKRFNSYVRCHRQICVQFGKALFTHISVLSHALQHIMLWRECKRCQQHSKTTTLTAIIYCDKQLTWGYFWCSHSHCFCMGFLYKMLQLGPASILWYLLYELCFLPTFNYSTVALNCTKENCFQSLKICKSYLKMLTLSPFLVSSRHICPM